MRVGKGALEERVDRSCASACTGNKPMAPPSSANFILLIGIHYPPVLTSQAFCLALFLFRHGAEHIVHEADVTGKKPHHILWDIVEILCQRPGLFPSGTNY
jgi:hypothetical protein